MGTNDPASTFASLLQRLQDELQLLPDKPDESPEITLRCLWALAEDRPLAISQAATFTPGALDDAGLARLHALVGQRLAGTPLAHLTGRQDFMGQVLLASPAALSRDGKPSSSASARYAACSRWPSRGRW